MMFDHVCCLACLLVSLFLGIGLTWSRFSTVSLFDGRLGEKGMTRARFCLSLRVASSSSCIQEDSLDQ